MCENIICVQSKVWSQISYGQYHLEAERTSKQNAVFDLNPENQSVVYQLFQGLGKRFLNEEIL